MIKIIDSQEFKQYYSCPNLDFKEGVETNHDECNGVG